MYNEILYLQGDIDALEIADTDIQAAIDANQMNSESADLTLTNLINAYANSINANTNNVSNVEAINTAQSIIISDLQNEVSDLQNEIADLQSEVSVLQNKIVIGCAYPQYSGVQPMFSGQIYVDVCATGAEGAFWVSISDGNNLFWMEVASNYNY